MNTEEKIHQLIQERVAKLKTHGGKKYFDQNPSYPQQQKEKDLQDIQKRLKSLKHIHSQLEKKVQGLKSLVPEISEQTTVCAVYLVYGKVLQTWKVVFFLAEKGNNFETMELIRSINESLDLINVFHLDEEEKYVQKWFDGEIIKNDIGRRLIDKFIVEGGVKSVREHNLSPYDMANDIYKTFSKYTHYSYAALLDSVDVFNEDFDWSGYAGAHYTLHNMDALKETMVTTLITLKMTYSKLKKMEDYKEIDKILIEFAGPMDEQSLEGLIPQIKK